MQHRLFGLVDWLLTDRLIRFHLVAEDINKIRSRSEQLNSFDQFPDAPIVVSENCPKFPISFDFPVLRILLQKLSKGTGRHFGKKGSHKRIPIVLRGWCPQGDSRNPSTSNWATCLGIRSELPDRISGFGIYPYKSQDLLLVVHRP